MLFVRQRFPPHMPVARRVCSFCVMDDSIPLRFDARGQCECCRAALTRLPQEYWPNAKGEAYFEQLVAQLKQEGQQKRYDAMVGLSGGTDSGYLAHVCVRKYGLRVLAVHV